MLTHTGPCCSQHTPVRWPLCWHTALRAAAHHWLLLPRRCGRPPAAGPAGPACLERRQPGSSSSSGNNGRCPLILLLTSLMPALCMRCNATQWHWQRAIALPRICCNNKKLASPASKLSAGAAQRLWHQGVRTAPTAALPVHLQCQLQCTGVTQLSLAAACSRWLRLGASHTQQSYQHC